MKARLYARYRHIGVLNCKFLCATDRNPSFRVLLRYAPKKHEVIVSDVAEIRDAGWHTVHLAYSKFLQDSSLTGVWASGFVPFILQPNA